MFLGLSKGILLQKTNKMLKYNLLEKCLNYFYLDTLLKKGFYCKLFVVSTTLDIVQFVTTYITVD